MLFRNMAYRFLRQNWPECHLPASMIAQGAMEHSKGETPPTVTPSYDAYELKQFPA